ncbi:ribosome biogenesis GTP-binding protein YsxC/EngB [Desulfosporosinus orientis DSM 765]|uniref:Probable GTP-binding protein EngB n=1 Tax=Desulfosporosinus orientis (strain ATCC 19365 / DSM 765 / NCIMB 8382 / VKM B-1628 / Singapore I) TaxID=768706 RepID=G7W9Q5_DESOD|nr:ribosome biogenesis GTP-binding protein YihA/YsxC [Desulfosporosinus orientis]AET70621.1 ribosome biogenesis GTP-binding protein YsxC/EngB [Desulfosporosinus orientis DSM 765]
MIVVKKAEYTASAVKYEQYPTDGLPEIAMAGRSNVGKSSLINSFLGRRNLARTGNTPGKTQTLNFYRVNDAWFLVDLPGYGYAKVAKTVNAQWGPMMENYLKKREQLRAVIQIVDIRHAPSVEDREMHEWLRVKQVPTMVVATKADKIARGQWLKHLKVIAKDLEIPDVSLILPFSSQSGVGKKELNEAIEEILGIEEV